MRTVMIIERIHRGCDTEYLERVEHETGFENITKHAKVGKHTANMLDSAKGYAEYIEQHGYHFTNTLAEHVSKMMVNANGSTHSWTADQVKKSMESLGLSIHDKVTTGDVTYLANMYYSDFYPDPLKDEASCLRAAYRIAHDPDGYDGMIFCRWTADVIGKAIKIDWEKFI